MNNLKDQTSPYLLQHANNPVNWYPWCAEAFEKAKSEDKPIFLSIGYSTCHWCHVMAHESFENKETADILNENYIAIKVDKEERPDIDSIYMQVCQSFTGRGGWPMSIFMTPDQKPFLAGTYFPKTSLYGMISFNELLQTVSRKWKTSKEELIRSSDEIVKQLNVSSEMEGSLDTDILTAALSDYRQNFDSECGGFGNAPKFPAAHNLLFLMDQYETKGDKKALSMAETTLFQMYKGGIFDHIGYGFSRYSTDRYFLVPHFEKMLYDNALLMMAYTKLYYITKKDIYKKTAEKTAVYILREMTSPEGGFYCAQDADSEGIEGRYYVFDYNEITQILNQDDGERFCAYYGITKKGNFEGKNIPNLLFGDRIDESYEKFIPAIYEYRKKRASLHLDDKNLTSWNSLMISAFSYMYRVFENAEYLEAAKKACSFIESKMCTGNTLSVSYRAGEKSGTGFLDDYAYFIFALLGLYDATLDSKFLDRAKQFCDKAVHDFLDSESGGFYLYGAENEQLISKPKETYDGAIPSGNSVMAFNLVKLAHIEEESTLYKQAEDQLKFMSSQARSYPAGHSFFLLAVSEYFYPHDHIVCVLKNPSDLDRLRGKLRIGSNIKIINGDTEEYKLQNDQTTFYICRNRSCFPPTNDFSEVIK